MLKKFINISVFVVVSLTLFANVTPIQAGDSLGLDRTYQSTINIFEGNQGVLQFEYPGQMHLLETDTTIELNTTYDLNTAIANHETFIGSISLTSVVHLANLPELSLFGGEAISDVEALAKQVPTILPDNHVILSQTPFTVGERNVIEFVVLTDVKYSIFIVQNDIPLVVIARSRDYYSDSIRNTALNMIGTFEVSMDEVVQPRNLSTLLAESAPLNDLTIGNRLTFELTNGQRGRYVDITVAEGERYFVHLTPSEAHSRAIIWILDTDANVVTNAIGEYPLPTGFARTAGFIFNPRQAGQYTLLISLIGNEVLGNDPLSGTFKFAYQKIETLPYEGAFETQSILTFAVDASSTSENLNITYAEDDFNNDDFYVDIFSADLSQIVYSIFMDGNMYGGVYLQDVPDGQQILQRDLTDMEGDFIIIVGNTQEASQSEPAQISLTLE